MKKVNDIKSELVLKYNNNDFVIDKTNVKMIELLGESFIADEESIFGKVNKDYVQKELDWYKSKSLYVYDMPDPPEIWKMVADYNGYINSNYGWVIFDQENGYQYNHALNTLKLHKDTRRSVMIYNRPSMQVEFNKHEMSDFMCTNAVTYFIRDDKLNCVVQMRSNDAVFGYKNDRFWQNWVLNKLLEDLLDVYPNLKVGDIIWNAASLHVYERHFKLIK